MNMVRRVYNLTPHSIDICDEELKKVKSIKPEGLVVRAKMEEEVWCTLSASEIPVWSVQVTDPTIEENPFAPRRIGTPIGKTQEIFIIVSRTAADAILKDNSAFNVIWDYIEEDVRQINVLTVHKSQFDRETGERYGALGFALQGQIGR
tara:strand:+ start:48 stop:494 length:447 start_codon:yes stop_codon:yes gene_type:complete